MKTLLLLFCAAGLILATTQPATAQTTQPARVLAAPTAAIQAAADDTPSQVLGDRFTTLAGGISFRPPAGGQQIKPANMGTHIVQYVNTDEKWALKISRMIFDQPAPLRGKDNPQTPIEDESKTKPGVLDQVVQQIMLQTAGAKILRQDIVNVGRHDTGMLVSRFTQGPQVFLRQMALIQKNDQLYYVFDLTTPSSRNAADDENEEDPSEVLAVRIFSLVLDSVQLLDQGVVLMDRDVRLYRTKVFMTNLPGRITRAVTPELYLRILKAGQDIGWMFVSEEPGQRQGQKGLFVAVASQTLPEPGARLDVATEMFCTDNRQSEAWVTMTVVEKDGRLDHVSEFGQSRVTRVLDEKNGLPDPLDPGQPKFRQVPQISVTQTSTLGSTPVTRTLPPYYLPQPLCAMLPRLMPLDEAKGYVFAVWVSGERDLVLRFIDVQRPRTLNFAGQNVLAIAVKDRIGLEGDPTFHYLTPDGHYLGSETPSTAIQLQSTDLKTLANLWPKAKIVRPKVLDVPLPPHKSADKK